MKITLATLSTATAQQVFEQVRDHMLRQGKKSLVHPSSADCAYRSHDGLQCAAGCLIGDDEYDTAFENRPWWALSLMNGPVPSAHRVLIGRLQSIHDGLPVSEWEAYLRDLAETFGLVWTITLATLPTASAQEVFEQAVKHTLAQGGRCVDAFGTCVYRNTAGLKCAAGALLSDADVETALGGDVRGSWVRLVNEGKVPDKHYNLIVGLQRVHDYHTNWRGGFRFLASEHGLDDSFMDLPPVPYVPVSNHETALA